MHASVSQLHHASTLKAAFSIIDGCTFMEMHETSIEETLEKQRCQQK
jgi:hypothetical protein